MNSFLDLIKPKLPKLKRFPISRPKVGLPTGYLAVH